MARLGVLVCLVVAVMALFPVPVCAQACSIKEHGGSATAFVIKPGKSGEFFAMARSKQHAEALACCVSCVVPAGTPIVITESGVFSSSVRVTGGPHRGCAGEVPREFIGGCR